MTAFIGAFDRPERIPYVLGSEQAHQHQVQNSQEKHHNGYLIDAVHHSDVDVGRPGRIFLAEKITAYLAEGKELLPPCFLLVVVCLMCFHTHVTLRMPALSNCRPRG